MSQTTVQNAAAVRFGSGKVEIGDSVGALTNLGAMQKIVFEESWDTVSIMSDNAGEIAKRIKNHQASISGELIEIDLSKLNIIRGGLDTYATVSAAPVSVTDEAVKLYDTDFATLAHKNADGSEVGSIVVTSAAGGGTTYTRNTDYIIAVDADGYTGIARVSGGAISDEATIYVDYSYTPASAVTLSSGGLAEIDAKVIRITNTDDAGKIFRITVYKASNEEAIKLELNSDDADDPNVVPIKMVGTCDTTRTAGDQLFEIYDEQGV